MRVCTESPFRHIHEESCGSTQDLALQFARDAELVGLVSTFHQTQGRGRGNRKWLTPPGEALTFSAIQWAYADYSGMPFLGMAWAIAVARVCDAQLQWPNDVVIAGKKLGGILTEVVHDLGGRRIAVIGVGVNLLQTAFPPEITHRATSLAIAGRPVPKPESLLESILEEVKRLPEPDTWAALEPHWMERDATPGKQMIVPHFGTVIATGIDDHGNLVGKPTDGTLAHHGNEKTIVTSVGEVVYERSN